MSLPAARNMHFLTATFLHFIPATDTHSKGVKDTYADVFGTVKTEGAKPANPPANNTSGTYTLDQIKSMSPKEINANWEQVQKSLKTT